MSRYASFVVVCLFLGACSASEGSTSKNTISPYDQEFAPEDSDTNVSSNLSEEDYLERAKNAYDRGLYTVARENWSTLREQYPSSYYTTLAELKIADTYYYSSDFGTAVTFYEEFLKLHPAHEATPYVRYQLGNAHRELYAGLEHDQAPLQAALRNYMLLIDNYPSSEFVLPARRGISTSRELLGEHEHFIARFYAQQGQEKARTKRLQDLVRDYPETLAAQKARDELSEHAPGTPRVVSSRASQAPTRAGQKPTEQLALNKRERPNTPRLLIAGKTDVEEIEEARFSLQKPSRIEESNIPATRKAKPFAAATSTAETKSTSALKYLNCSEENGLQVFTARFASNIEILGTAAKDPNKLVLRNVGAKMPTGILQTEDRSVLKECKVKGSRVLILPVRGSSDVFVAQIESSKTAKPEVFTLDRPARLVVILDN